MAELLPADPAAVALLSQPTAITFEWHDPSSGRRRPLRGANLAAVVADASAGDDDMSTIAAWLVDQKSPHTRDAYAVDLERWSRFLYERDVALTEARRRDAAAWRQHMAEPRDGSTKDSNATINRRLSSMSSLYRHLAGLDLVPGNPFDGLDRFKVQGSEQHLTSEQVVALLRQAHAAGPRTEVLIHLLYFNGLRVSEVTQANIADIRDAGSHRVLGVTRKGSLHTRVPLVPVTLAAIDRWLPLREEQLAANQAQAADIAAKDHSPTSTSDILTAAAWRRAEQRRQARSGTTLTARWADAQQALLLNTTGWRLTRQTALSYVNRVARDAGLGDAVTPHVLRATFATELADRNVPLHRIQQALDHASIDTTAGYIRSKVSLDDHPAYLLADLHAADLTI